jgi:excisionase family DNA binding protein
LSEENRLLTTKEAAERMGVSTRRVQAMIKAGRLSASKMGRDWVIYEAEVERVEQQQRKPGRPRKN